MCGKKDLSGVPVHELRDIALGTCSKKTGTPCLESAVIQLGERAQIASDEAERVSAQEALREVSMAPSVADCAQRMALSLCQKLGIATAMG
jgi:hypothetical protein